MAGTYQSFLIIADITGYTTYLSQSELEHAQEVLTSLIGLLMNSARPPLKVSGLEGDAVFSHAIPGLDLQPQTFVEIIESTYVAFRRAIDLMVLNNTCQCRACANIANLDLKFFIHHGSFAIQRLGDREELVGTDVILIHRLLKNHIREQTGIAAYAVYTSAALEKLGLLYGDFVEHREVFENLGDTRLFVRDMQPIWQRELERRIVEVPSDSIVLEGSVDLNVPPEVAWDYLSRLEFRQLLVGADRMEVADRQSDNRVGEGSSYTCYHGGRQTKQLVLEWRPFERIVTKDQVNAKLTCLTEFSLTPTEAGTMLSLRIGGFEGPSLTKLFMATALKAMKKKHQQDLAHFAEAVAAAEAAPAVS
ncbi:MAG TPA: DUF2652 domain-containing protein [Acidimicrobiia bacterium]